MRYVPRSLVVCKERYNLCMNRVSLDRVSWTSATPVEPIFHELYLILNWYKTSVTFIIKLRYMEIHHPRPPRRSCVLTQNKFFWSETLHFRYLSGFWICLSFWICQSSEYTKVVNMPGLHSVLNMPEYTGKIPEYAWLFLNMFECA